MHARSAEISGFLNEDLLPQVREAFRAYASADRAELEREQKAEMEERHILFQNEDKERYVGAMLAAAGVA